MKIKVIFILIFLLVSKLLAQEYPTKIAEYKNNDIVFRIEFNDLLYKLNDTLTIRYKVMNNSESAIYIFDPPSYHIYTYSLNYKDSLDCFFDVELGGTWEHLIGYEQILFIRKVDKLSNFEYEFKFIISNTLFENSCSDQIFPYNYLGVTLYDGIYFDIGYIFEIDSKIEVKNSIEAIVLSYKEKIWLDNHLSRFILGPIWIRHK